MFRMNRFISVLLLLVVASPALSAVAQSVTYIHTDALGSVVAESDASGNVIKRYDYEPYGAVVGGQVADGPGYTGHVSDSATGLSYMQQRYMDPQLGVFLSVDPVTVYDGEILHFNLYAYAYNNPYKFTDPDGRCPQCLWGAPIGAAVSIGVQMAMAEGSVGERFSQVSWGQVGIATAAGALSGGVSAIASTAATTGGSIAANVIGNAAVGAVATQASAQAEGRTASVSEVAKGSALSGGTAGLGAAISAAPGVVAKGASASMTQTERTATTNLLQGIRETTPGFNYSNPIQTTANVAGSAVSSSGDLKPLLDQKK